MQLPSLTPKQQTILHYLYRYRFLQREQIQALLGHKDKRRISAWLKDLREKQYIGWVYDADDFIGRIQPASYYLDLNAIRYLKTTDQYPQTELRKRYREPSRSEGFIERSVLLAKICIDLSQKSGQTAAYDCITQADYRNPTNEYYFLATNEIILPHLCIIEQQATAQLTYLLEVLDASLPQYRLKKRLKDYVTFLTTGEWESERKSEALPIILLIVGRTTDLIYAKRRIKKLLEAVWDTENIHIRLTTTQKLNQQGFAGDIWEEVRVTK